MTGIETQRMAAQVVEKLNPYRNYILIIVLTGVFMGVLDANVTNIALPTITAFFGVDIAQSQWVITAYILANTSLLLIFGRLSDFIGKTKLFMAGFAIFVVSSLLCGLSNGIFMLIVCRGLQGIGASMVYSISTAIIVQAFPMRERGKMLGFIGTTVAMGSIVGPILGGFIVDSLGWQYLFYINLPIGVVLLAVAWKYLKIDEKRDPVKVDWTGAGCLIVFMSSLMLLLSDFSSTMELTLNKYIYAAIVAGSFALFIFTELKHKAPIVDLAIFKVKKFTFANLSSLISFITFSLFIISMPFYMEIVMGFKPSQVGQALMVLPILMAVTAPISGWIYDKFHSTFHSSFGLLVTSIAMAGMSWFTLTRNLYALLGCFILLGVGTGLFNSPNNTEIMSSLPPQKSGAASSMMATVRNFANSLGISFATILLYMLINSNGTVTRVIEASPDSMAAAVSGLMLLASVLALIGVFTSLMVKYHGLVFKDKS